MILTVQLRVAPSKVVATRIYKLAGGTRKAGGYGSGDDGRQISGPVQENRAEKPKEWGQHPEASACRVGGMFGGRTSSPLGAGCDLAQGFLPG